MNNPFLKFYNSGTWQTLALNLVSGTALLVAAAWFSFTLFYSRDADLPPRVVNSISIEPTTLLVGKPFTARINVTLNRLCPYEVRWSLVRVDDNVEAIKIVLPIRQPPAALGTQDLIVERFVPASVEPGEYKYVSDVSDLCPDGHTYISVRKNVNLTIR